MKRIRNILLLSILFSNTILAQQKPDFVVAADGSGDFVTVQEAINAVPDMRSNRTVIYIKPGIYKEKLT